MGAMSLGNVGVFALSAAAAVAGSISAAPSAPAPTATFRACPYVSCIMWLLPLILPHGHLHVGVGPAALKAGASLTRFVVGLHAQQVIARGVEGCGCADHRALLFDGNPPLVEDHFPG